MKLFRHKTLCTTLHGQINGKAGIHLKYYPENRDTFQMYPGKVMHMIGGWAFDPRVLLFQPTMHCHSHSLGFLYKMLLEYSR